MSFVRTQRKCQTAEMQSVHSKVTADWARNSLKSASMIRITAISGHFNLSYLKMKSISQVCCKSVHKDTH